MKRDEVIGKKFGTLTVLGFAHHPDDHCQLKFAYRCECGHEGFMTKEWMMANKDITCPRCRIRKNRSKKEEVLYEF